MSLPFPPFMLYAFLSPHCLQLEAIMAVAAEVAR